MSNIFPTIEKSLILVLSIMSLIISLFVGEWAIDNADMILYYFSITVSLTISIGLVYSFFRYGPDYVIWINRKRKEREAISLERKQLQENFKIQLRVAEIMITQMKKNYIYAKSIGDMSKEIKLAAIPVSVMKYQDSLPIPSEFRKNNLSEKLVAYQPGDMVRLFIYGPSGSGKSSLLHHIVDKFNGNVIFCTPHEFVDQTSYPYSNKEVITISLDNGGYDNAHLETIKLINKYADLITSRLERLNQRHSPMLLIIDEWMSLVKFDRTYNGKNSILDNLFKICTQARKVNMGIILSAHSDRVELSGFKNAKDLLDGFVRVNLIYNKNTQDRYCEVIYQGEENNPDIYNLPLPHPIILSNENYQRSLPESRTLPIIEELNSLPSPIEDQPIKSSTGKDIARYFYEVFIVTQNDSDFVPYSDIEANFRNWCRSRDLEPSLPLLQTKLRERYTPTKRLVAGKQFRGYKGLKFE